MQRPYQKINRRKSKSIKIGDVEIGNNAPISVQTMTNTLTKDINSTIRQIRRIEKVGDDLVRCNADPALCSSIASTVGPELFKRISDTILTILKTLKSNDFFVKY